MYYLREQVTERNERGFTWSRIFFFLLVLIAKNGDRDGIPNVIPEAMSAGCLILASC